MSECSVTEKKDSRKLLESISTMNKAYQKAAPIVHINGYPGVGKLTIARAMRDLCRLKILDNHSIYNVAFALLDFGTVEFKKTVVAVEEIALSAIKFVPKDIPIIITNSLFSDSEWGCQRWQSVVKAGESQHRPVAAVTLKCDLINNQERLAGYERENLEKLTDVAELKRLRNRPLLEVETDFSLDLDVSHLVAHEAASEILSWINSVWPELNS